MNDGRLMLTGVWFLCFAMSGCGYAIGGLFGSSVVFGAIGLTVIAIAAWRIWGEQ